MVEQGYKDIALQEWLGWFVPREPADGHRAEAEPRVRDGLQSPDLVAGLANNALQPTVHDAGRVRRLLKQDSTAGRPIVKATGFNADGVKLGIRGMKLTGAQAW